MVVSKKYIKYCSAARVSSDACLEQTSPGREKQEDWANRGNVRGADSALIEMETSRVRHQIHLSLRCGIVSDNTLMTKIISGVNVCDEVDSGVMQHHTLKTRVMETLEDEKKMLHAHWPSHTHALRHTAVTTSKETVFIAVCVCVFVMLKKSFFHHILSVDSTCLFCIVWETWGNPPT